MTEKEKPTLVDFEAVKIEILTKVSEAGPMGEIESWKKAYPEVFFGDENFIDWKERKVAEKLFYVVLNKAKNVELSFSVVVDRVLQENKVVTDKETLMEMWMEGCFCGEELDEAALREFLTVQSTDSNQHSVELIHDLDLGGTFVRKMNARLTLW